MFIEHRAGYQSLSVSLTFSADDGGLLWFGNQRLGEPYAGVGMPHLRHKASIYAGRWVTDYSGETGLSRLELLRIPRGNQSRRGLSLIGKLGSPT